MKTRTISAIGGVLPLLLAAGCSGAHGAAPSALGTGRPAVSSAPSAARSPSARGGSNATGAPQPSERATASPANPDFGSHSATPPPYHFASDIPVRASLSKPCIRPGDVETLTVVTVPRGGVVYVAVYADGGGGAASPFGNGYGGNDKGYADKQGNYRSTWTVASNAPVGKGYVDVYVGYNSKWGRATPVLTVARTDGSCS